MASARAFCAVAWLFAADLAAARSFAETDPYAVEGVFASLEVRETLQVFPREAP